MQETYATNRRVGPPETFDLIGALQFGLLTCKLGLRRQHTLLDIGCGCLRGGKFFIPYLDAGNYFGIEPNSDALQTGIHEELGDFHLRLKRPTFSNDDTFTLSAFGRAFDFLLAQSIFSHTSPEQAKRCLQESAKVMTKGSLFAATYVPGERSYSGATWTRVATYRTEDFHSWANDAGLRAEPIDWHHPGQKWLLLTLR